MKLILKLKKKTELQPEETTPVAPKLKKKEQLESSLLEAIEKHGQ